MPRRLSPYVIHEKPGKVAWCACGESERDPYCDGSHARKNTGKVPVVAVVEKEGPIAWCGCKEAASRPYCNGSHAKRLLGGPEHFESVSTWRAKGCHSGR